MTNREIYNAALSLCGSKPASPEASYEERAKTLLPLVLISLTPTDTLIKRYYGKAPVPIREYETALDSNCALEPILFSAAAYLLASELTAFEDEVLSETFMKKSNECIIAAEDSIPYSIKKIF